MIHIEMLNIMIRNKTILLSFVNFVPRFVLNVYSMEVADVSVLQNSRDPF